MSQTLIKDLIKNLIPKRDFKILIEINNLHSNKEIITTKTLQSVMTGHFAKKMSLPLIDYHLKKYIKYGFLKFTKSGTSRIIFPTDFLNEVLQW